MKLIYNVCLIISALSICISYIKKLMFQNILHDNKGDYVSENEIKELMNKDKKYLMSLIVFIAFSVLYGICFPVIK